MAGPLSIKEAALNLLPQDDIKLDLVPVFLPTKELWATEPKTWEPMSPESIQGAVKPAHLTLPLHIGGTAW